jgi:lysophospholipase L1-like esterase
LNGAKPDKFGTLNLVGYDEEFSTNTYCGAIESLFKRLLTTYPNAKIGVIIAQKMGVSNNYTKEGNNRRAYFEVLIQLCEKWGIPYINLWDKGRLNPKLSVYYTNGSEGEYYTDGQHLTAKGYDLISPMIEEWMRTL